MQRTSTVFAVIALAALGLSGCGGISVHEPAKSAGFELEPAYEIADEDIRNTFDARPQLPERLQIAYFSFDVKRSDALGATVSSINKVVGSYQIPTLLVTGERRFDEAHYYFRPETTAPSIKKLRLLAARAKSDVLIVFDYGYRRAQSANAWAVTGILLVPLFFVPMADYEIESYLDAYVIDVRNGYLYGQLSASARDEVTETLSSDIPDQLLDTQWQKLQADTKAALAKLLADPASRVPPATSPPDKHQADARSERE